jgi:membrane protease YdiL (CAAX protease family)
VELLSVFVNPAYQVRSGWKFMAYASLWVVTVLIVQTAALFLFPAVFQIPHGDFRFLSVNAVVIFVPSAAVLLAMSRLLDPAPLAAFGVALHERWLRDFAIGLTVAAVMLVAVLAGSFLLGDVRITWSGSLSALPAILLTLAALTVSAFSEELIFRGYPLQVLMKGLGPWGAIALLSFLFGLLHWMNPGATGMSVLGTVLAGVALSIAYVKTRSVWLPYGIHLGWNVGLSLVMGFTMSGIRTASFWSTSVSGSEALHGGNYGPEAGLLGCTVFAATCLAIPRIRALKVSPEVQAALATHSNKLYVEGIWKNSTSQS